MDMVTVRVFRTSPTMIRNRLKAGGRTKKTGNAMSNAVIDTNILVSGLWNPSGAPGMVLSMILSGRLTVWYTGGILCEYANVLHRKEFPFANADVDALLGFLQKKGLAATFTVSPVPFADESDRIRRPGKPGTPPAT